ncbi:MAG: TonB family protein [Sulfurimonas sp.]|uniref:energy transducer TonB family protein n=1 Tax=Sulfurimonas sp. TaxID=2022749 RepID=UPI0026057449|nr:energy transducer TonB [Sulfurimonas sp.]MDD2652318.1 TonB family protein [Sulfurimonas sp.]MDD3451513.1 TonB family protein [Sulfurimonas sp.]
MNRSYFALFVAFLIHVLILLLFWLLGTMAPEIKKEEKKENKIKISLKEMPKKFKDAGEVKEVIQKQPDIAPPMPKGSQLKEMPQSAPKAPVKYEPKKAQSQKPPKLNETKKEIQKEEAKAEPILKTEPLPPTKPFVPLHEEKKEQKKESLDWLYEDKTAQEAKEEKAKQKSGSSVGNSDLRELYGDEFGKLTKGQQKYLIDNQEIMRRITQEILNRVARVNIRHDMNVNKVNIVEFYLHPNGDMTDFKFLQPSGYHVLDQTTQETIEFAYSRYPRPDEKILVRYNVFYNLAR